MMRCSFVYAVVERIADFPFTCVAGRGLVPHGKGFVAVKNDAT